MTDYRLVPVEPPLDMLCEGLEVYASEDCAEADVLGIYKAMLAAAPAVQGEPDHARIRQRFDEIEREICEGKHTASSVFTQMRAAAFYTDPKPAEQQPQPESATHYRPSTGVYYQVIDGKTYAWRDAKVGWMPSPRKGIPDDCVCLMSSEQQPALTKYQPCGCVICTCEHETQCQGCGAKHCGTHLVGQIPGPVYQQPAPDAVEIDPKDLIVQPWSSRVRSQWDYSLERGVKITHVPSGITVTCDAERSMYANKNKALCDLQTQLAVNPAPDVAGLVEALESLIKGYVGLLEAGMDRITSLGGDCDPVPVMEQNDPWLRDARAALAAHRKQGSEA